MIGNVTSPVNPTEIPHDRTTRLHPSLLVVVGVVLIASAYLSAGTMGAVVVLWGEIVLVLSCALR